MRTIDPVALDRIDSFVRAGGTLLVIGQFPLRVYPGPAVYVIESWFKGGAVPDAPGQWTAGKGRIILVNTGGKLRDVLPAELPRNIRFLQGHTSAVYSTVRRTGDTTAWLVVNDRGAPLSITLELPRHLLPAGEISLSAMDPVTGIDCNQAFEATGGGIRTELRLDHTQATILTAHSGARQSPASAVAPFAATGRVRELSDWTIRLVQHGLDSRWTDKPVEEWVGLPVWKVCARGWRRLEGWTLPGYDDSSWKQVAVTRGRALLGDEVVLMRAHLPPGATALKLPLPVSGEYVLHVNGRQIAKRLGPPPRRGTLDISRHVNGINDVIALEVSAMQGLSGLEASPEALCGETALPRLMGWDALRLGWYSGRALYRTTVTLPAAPRGRVWLDLGRVEHYAEVWVNGRRAATLIWPPYRAEIGSFLRKGRNSVALVVSNSLASRFLWDDWGTRDGSGWGVGPTTEASGLIGPVTLG